MRGVFTLIMLLTGKTKINDVLSNPFAYLKFPLFIALQSFLYKIFLCILRRLRAKSDEDGKNSFIAGVISGLSILLV